jgi:two-component sensor histidine kinase
MPQPQIWIDSAAHYAQLAIKLAYRTRLLKSMTAQSLEQLAMRYKYLHMVERSEKGFMQVIRFSDSLGAGLSRTREYSFLCNLYVGEGNFHKAREYGILAEQAVNSSTSDHDLGALYLHLGGLYAALKNDEQVVHYYGKLLANPYKYKGFIGLYAILDSYCGSLKKLGRQNEMLPFVQQFKQRYPPETEYEKLYHYLVLATCYMEKNEFGLAETSYLEAVRYAEALHLRTGPIYFTIGIFYVRNQKWEKALVALKNAERTELGPSSMYMSNILSAIARTEAALGNHANAYDYLYRSKTLTDSIYTVAKARLADELDAQYRTRLKEDTLREREANIRMLKYEADKMKQKALLKDAELEQAALLSQKNKADLEAMGLKAKNAEVIQKNAEVIEKNYKLQQTAIEQVEAKKKITYTVMALLVVIVGLLCWLFWTKQKSNKVITLKNDQLQELVKDKIWLLKEMHHRVKNNLHIIGSLLEFQSAYLQDDALDAIRHSQSRIFAMSLIHQKLYQTEDAKTIDMASYIPELVDYLQETFGMEGAVQISMNIDPAVFNVEEAVPLGLIINEAVTNSMKYAFTAGQSGKIDINLKATNKDEYELVLADNGRGLRKDFDFGNTTSLGFQLIKGLAGQLKAKLSIINEDGLKITVAGIIVTQRKVPPATHISSSLLR